MAVMYANPYVAGNPVGDSPAFVGRADVLREVQCVLRHKRDNAIILYGQRRIGKTSILQHLAARLPEEGAYHPVYFDLQDKAAWPLDRLLQDMARTIAHTLDQPDPDLGPDLEAAFRDEWLPTILDDLPEGAAVVLLLDEFDVLADRGAERAEADFFPYLRKLLSSAPERLQFVFVMQRNVHDLSTVALSLIKGIPSQLVSLLSQADTAQLVRLSEANGTLLWPDEAVEQVWRLTHGHPFLTQQLCSEVWEQAYEEEQEEPPTVTPVDIDAAVPYAMEFSRHAMEWLWDGLPPAERLVASALAEAGSDAITSEGLERLLGESGVRVVIRELQSAPQLLQDWDLIEPADGGHRFRVELLRRWIAENRPPRRVQEELDRIEPVAENLYKAAQGLYQGGQPEQAVNLLRQAIDLNPNHVRANQLLADILLAQGNANEAAQLLERLYEYQPADARPRLVQTLLTQALSTESREEQLALYKRVLELDARQAEARTQADKIRLEMDRQELAIQMKELDALEKAARYNEALALARKLVQAHPDLLDSSEWQRRLELIEDKVQVKHLYRSALDALQSDDRQKAQTLLAQVVALEPTYEEATRYLHLAVTGIDVEEIAQEMRRRVASAQLQELETLEQQKRYPEALDFARMLATEYPEIRDWPSCLERLERAIRLSELYGHALEAVQGEDLQAARDLLVQVVTLDPDYEEATRFLHLVVTGIDVAELQTRLRARERVHLGAAVDGHQTWDRLPERRQEISALNPFRYDGCVSPGRFFGRRREMQYIVGRILNQGQSTAVTGGPRSGKTSLLEYITTPETRDRLYGEEARKLLFSYIDVRRLNKACTRAEFWEIGFQVLSENVIASGPDSPIAHAYQLCQENSFGTFVLERLLAQMGVEKWRLVLVLDDFDQLLQHPNLGRAEFFGTLNSLASRSRGALAIVVASRLPLAGLHETTQQWSVLGSPYFDFLTEITLGPLSDVESDALLRQSGDRFAEGDLQFIGDVAGGHPYLLQVAASALWEAYVDDEINPDRRQEKAGQILLTEAKRALNEMWQLWTTPTQRAFTAVSLAHMSHLANRESLVLVSHVERTYPEQINIAAIRRLLRDAFTPQDLRRFCQDSSAFRVVGSYFGPNSSLEDMIDVLMDYSQKRLLFSELLPEIQRCNPRQYERYAANLYGGFVDNLEPELQSLEKQGFVRQDEKVFGGWRVFPSVFLRWMFGGLLRESGAGGTSRY